MEVTRFLILFLCLGMSQQGFADVPNSSVGHQNWGSEVNRLQMLKYIAGGKGAVHSTQLPKFDKSEFRQTRISQLAAVNPRLAELIKQDQRAQRFGMDRYYIQREIAQHTRSASNATSIAQNRHIRRYANNVLPRHNQQIAATEKKLFPHDKSLLRSDGQSNKLFKVREKLRTLKGPALTAYVNQIASGYWVKPLIQSQIENAKRIDSQVRKLDQQIRKMAGASGQLTQSQLQQLLSQNLDPKLAKKLKSVNASQAGVTAIARALAKHQAKGRLIHSTLAELITKLNPNAPSTQQLAKQVLKSIDVSNPRIQTTMNGYRGPWLRLNSGSSHLSHKPPVRIHSGTVKLMQQAGLVSKSMHWVDNSLRSHGRPDSGHQALKRRARAPSGGVPQFRQTLGLD